MKTCLVFAITLFITTNTLAQVNDLELITSKSYAIPQYEVKRKVTYLFANSKNVIVKYNPVSLVFGGMMLLYQKVISQQIGASCPYEISCSAYGKQSIVRWGFIKGIPLTADRLMRCTKLASVDIGTNDFTKDGRIIDNPQRYSFTNDTTTYHSH